MFYNATLKYKYDKSSDTQRLTYSDTSQVVKITFSFALTKNIDDVIMGVTLTEITLTRDVKIYALRSYHK